MKYIVIKKFRDLQDDGRIYNAVSYTHLSRTCIEELEFD